MSSRTAVGGLRSSDLSLHALRAEHRCYQRFHLEQIREIPQIGEGKIPRPRTEGLSLLKTRLSQRSCVVRSDRLFGRSWSDGLESFFGHSAPRFARAASWRWRISRCGSNSPDVIRLYIARLREGHDGDLHRERVAPAGQCKERTVAGAP